MKIFKRILLGLLVLFLAGSTGGYFYFKNKFMGASPNTLTLSNVGQPVDFLWRGMEINGKIEPHVAMFVPVTLPGIDRVFYMQFDTGAPSTVLNYGKVNSINKRYGNVFTIDTTGDNFSVSNAEFHLGEMRLSASNINFRGKSQDIDWTDSTALIKIGTIGSDFIEHHPTMLDFKNNQITLLDAIPDSINQSASFSPFEFEGRKVFLKADLNDLPTDLWYDSGSSAFELIVDEQTFHELAVDGATANSFVGNSWGNGVTIHNIASDGKFKIGSTVVPLTYVTYIEWPNKLQTMMMKLSNLGGDLGGMTGNKLFLDKTLLLDAQTLRYTVLD